MRTRFTIGRSRSARTRRRWVPGVLAVAGVASLGVPAGVDAAGPVGRPAAADPAPDARFEVLTLGCSLRHEADAPAVHCRWSPPTIDAAAGLRLWRITIGSDAGRQVVFRTEDVTVGSFTDAPVRPGHRYIYVIQAVDRSGHTVGLSRRALVSVPPPPDDRPEVEVLRLECRAADDHTVGCSWSLPTRDGARTLTLWRSVNGGARERVVSSHHPFPSAYRDTVPDRTHRVAYAVIVTNGDGAVVARSRSATVTFRDTRPVDTRPVDTRPVDTRPVDTRPVDTRPVDTRPVDTRPVDTRPVDTRPVDTRPVDTRPVDTRPVDTRPVDTRPVDTRPVDTRPVDTRPVDTRPVDTRPDRITDHATDHRGSAD